MNKTVNRFIVNLFGSIKLIFEYYFNFAIKVNKLRFLAKQSAKNDEKN